MQLQLIIDFFKNLISPTPSVAENFVALLVAEEEKLEAQEETPVEPKKRTRKKKLEE